MEKEIDGDKYYERCINYKSRLTSENDIIEEREADIISKKGNRDKGGKNNEKINIEGKKRGKENNKRKGVVHCTNNKIQWIAGNEPNARQNKMRNEK